MSHVPGVGGFCEVYLFHRSSSTLVVTDLIQNLEPDMLPVWLRPMAASVGSTAPDGRAPIYLRAIVKAKDDMARAAGKKLVALQPERVILSRMGVGSKRLRRLRRSLRWLLPQAP